MTSKVVGIFAFLLTITSALALTCYKCDSTENKACGYGLTSFTYNTVDCNEEAGGGVLTDWVPKQCVKLITKDKEGHEQVARGCMPKVGGACNEVAKAMSVFSNLKGEHDEINCYPCDEDKCNTATKFTGYLFLGIVLAAIAFVV